MTKTSNRSGSALLIVLGMIAFMIVSAVTFSAFMRTSRLPSSYLRRTSASRQLVKAALARAIDEIDYAVANNPHPGVGNEGNRNYWTSRVLMTDSQSRQVNGNTVSVLSMEALAYIPPSLINEVRYYSRLTPTAEWKSFNFDAGRYAFCAVDVSDYFDINRVMAGGARSSAPNSRISLAYLFEQGEDHTGAGTGAKNWDEWMEQDFRKVNDDGTIDFSSKVPLVSMADFNLALYKKGGIGDFKSPFANYASGQGGDPLNVYGSDSVLEQASRMTFVTDSLMPSSNTNSSSSATSYDLAEAKNQPFTMEYLEEEKRRLIEFVDNVNMNNNSMRFKEKLSSLGCAVLCDYLDPDHVPVSLAIPTLERAPMICGAEIETVGNCVFKLSKEVGDESALSEQDKERVVTRTVNYNISPEFFDAFDGGSVNVFAAFPFTHEDDTDKEGSFAVDGRFSIFFTEGDAKLRDEKDNSPFQITSDKIDDSGVDEKNGIINLKLGENNGQAIKFNFPMTKEEDAIKRVPVRFNNVQKASSFFDGVPFLRVTYQWTQTRQGQSSTWSPAFAAVEQSVLNGTPHASLAPQPEGFKVHCPMPATKWGSTESQTLDEMSDDTSLADFLLRGGSKSLALRSALWMRVRDTKNSKTVDMAPASIRDDGAQKIADADDETDMARDVMKLESGSPLLLFKLMNEMTFSLKAIDDMAQQSQEIEVAASPKAAVVADPRYNHAPEDWYAFNGALSVSAWLDELENCDYYEDIFMMTSDAGYMQSPSEVSMLPRLSDLERNAGEGGFYGGQASARTELPQSYQETSHKNLFWRNYDISGDDRLAYNKLPWTCSGSGMKVNPYSDSTNVLMAAFANTPIDWKRASTNFNDKTSICAGGFMAPDFEEGSAEDFNKEYAYNQYSTDYKFTWKGLEAIAGNFIGRVKNKTASNGWVDAFDEMFRDSDENKFCGVDISSGNDVKLWNVDRKYLYGYWRDCFAAKQQLYLVFVRAEPVMMGSGMMGKIPPQLGGRAVALVWRNPAATNSEGLGQSGGTVTGYPHQTRVLFYRQLD